MDYSLLVGVRFLKAGEQSFFINDIEAMSYNFPFGPFRGSNGDGTYYQVEYYVGIIDILQPYNARKKVENALKRIRESQQEISCVDPVTYASRFLQFLK